MLQVIADHSGLELARETLHIHIVFDPVLIRRGLLLNDPSGAYLITAEINNSLIITDVQHGPLEYWVIQVFLAALVPDQTCRHGDQSGDS
jgi:hypothetical protein